MNNPQNSIEPPMGFLSCENTSTGNFTIHKPLGDGGFSNVYLGSQFSEEGEENFFAIKVLKTEHLPNKNAFISFNIESIILSSLDHPNIIR